MGNGNRLADRACSVAPRQINEWEAEQKMDEADLHRADQMRTYKIISEENWEHVKYKLDEVTAEIARYRADEEAAEADLRNATLQLEQSHVVAPFSGIVGARSLRLDQEVKKGDRALLGHRRGAATRPIYRARISHGILVGRCAT